MGGMCYFDFCINLLWFLTSWGLTATSQAGCWRVPSTWCRIRLRCPRPWAPPRSASPAPRSPRPGGSTAGGCRRCPRPAPGACPCPPGTPLPRRHPAPTAGPSRARRSAPRRSLPRPGRRWTPYCRGSGSPGKEKGGGSTACWLLKGDLFMLILHRTLSTSQWPQLTNGCNKGYLAKFCLQG